MRYDGERTNYYFTRSELGATGCVRADATVKVLTSSRKTGERVKTYVFEQLEACEINVRELKNRALLRIKQQALVLAGNRMGVPIRYDVSSSSVSVTLSNITFRYYRGNKQGKLNFKRERWKHSYVSVVRDGRGRMVSRSKWSSKKINSDI